LIAALAKLCGSRDVLLDLAGIQSPRLRGDAVNRCVYVWAAIVVKLNSAQRVGVVRFILAALVAVLLCGSPDALPEFAGIQSPRLRGDAVSRCVCVWAVSSSYCHSVQHVGVVLLRPGCMLLLLMRQLQLALEDQCFKLLCLYASHM
jgi:hypothetical protein